MKFLAMMTATLALGGCCSVGLSTQGGKDLVNIRNEGWKLLCCIPIASGDPNYPNGEVANWFEDTVTLKTNMQLLDDTMQAKGYRSVRNLCSHSGDETIVPLLFKRYIYHTSAELLK